MSNFFIAILVAASAGTWIYAKEMRRSGNNNKISLIVAGMTAGITFVVVLTIAITIDARIG